mgnify:CR=1 FL=1
MIRFAFLVPLLMIWLGLSAAWANTDDLDLLLQNIPNGPVKTGKANGYTWVEYCPDDDTHWFYRDEDAEKRDEDNADHNAGVVAIWRVLKADDINEDEVEE